MIKINNLIKEYKMGRRGKCVALKGINLNIQDAGLVFILGKSGSGKSTLLNLIGGLDSITKGTICVNGNEISKFKEGSLCNYRNNHIGFIFQDYHLIEELTIYENIVISLNLNKEKDEGLVKEALKRVDLEGYEKRYPRELSGGERQRIAIARAIIKKPHVILADEPTGNLDNNTATSIVALLKELSKECLILIVSHNTNDAYKYGDRVISLSDGNVINDVSRNKEYHDDVIIDNKELFYPSDRLLNDEDIECINNNIKDINKFVRITDKYIPTEVALEEDSKVDIKKGNLSFIETLKLSLRFLKSKIFRISLSSLISSAIIVILALALTIVTFDSGDMIGNELSNFGSKDVVYKKTDFKDPTVKHNQSYILGVEEGDIEDFYEAGYEGNIYKLYSSSLYMTNNNLNRFMNSEYFNKTSPYPTCTLGTLVCNEEYVRERFGDFKLLAEADVYEKGGFYITDYVADAIMLNLNYKSYESILGKYKPVKAIYGYVNGIIETNYKVKYEGVLKNLATMNSNQLKEYVSSKEYQEFYDYVSYYLGITYSFEPDYAKYNSESILCDWLCSMYNLNIHYNGKEYESNQYYIYYDEKLQLEGNECILNYSQYNAIFGTNYTTSNLNTFKPHTIVVDFYYNGDTEQERLIKSVEFNITKLVSNLVSIGCISEEVFKELAPYNVVNYGLYFDNISDVDIISSQALESGYSLKSYVASGLVTMTKAVDVFIPIFRLIAIVLCAGIILILTNFGIKMIKDKYHDIGILKALGTSNITIGLIFGIQVVLIAIFTIVLSTIGYLVFIDIANDVLIASLRELAKSHVVIDLDFLTFKGSVALIDTLLILGLTLVSLIIPFIKIRNIKPVKIIKTKE